MLLFPWTVQAIYSFAQFREIFWSEFDFCLFSYSYFVSIWNLCLCMLGFLDLSPKSFIFSLMTFIWFSFFSKL